MRTSTCSPTCGERRRGGGRLLAIGLLLATAVVALAPSAVRARAGTTPLPDRLTDREFWGLVERCSEANGFFRSDNLVSNERLFQNVVPALRQFSRGGVYLGVAPDQNFTYILALEPSIAFIVDIRRGNLDAHLMYKALFELSADRAEFLSRLFSRRRPARLGANATAGDLFAAFAAEAPDEGLFDANLKAIDARLTATHGFALTPDDLEGIAYVYGMFHRFGPDLTYSSSTQGNRGGGRGGRGARGMPTYGELQTTVAEDGRDEAYLGSEAHFQQLKALESKNLIVPVVGDFAGPKALRSVGEWLAGHGASVSVFYVSNVEQYLFQDGVAANFYANVATLPLDDQSAFLRSARGLDVLDPIRPFLADFTAGRIGAYADVTRRGRSE